jgi:hypothetical protein
VKGGPNPWSPLVGKNKGHMWVKVDEEGKEDRDGAFGCCYRFGEFDLSFSCSSYFSQFPSWVPVLI